VDGARGTLLRGAAHSKEKSHQRRNFMELEKQMGVDRVHCGIRKIFRVASQDGGAQYTALAVTLRGDLQSEMCFDFNCKRCMYFNSFSVVRRNRATAVAGAHRFADVFFADVLKEEELLNEEEFVLFFTKVSRNYRDGPRLC